MQKMKYRNLNLSGGLMIVLLSLFLSGITFAQQTKFEGKAEGQNNTLVRIITYADQFSRIEKTLGSTFTDSKGNFSLELNVDKTDYAYLAVGLKKGEFYISPSAEYNFNIQADTSTQKGSIFDELPLQFTYTANDDGLSDAITNFNVQQNTFLYQNANKIYYGRNKDFIAEYEDDIRTQFQAVNNEYFRNYIRYSFASLEWTSKMKDNDSIISEYFVNNPILYNNIQYTEFFIDFFKTYFVADKIFAYDELIESINQGSGIQEVKSLILRNNSFRGDPQITELVAILLVAKKYYNPDIIRKRVLDLLTEVKQNSTFPDNQKIAGDFINKLQYLEYGTPAPEFSLQDIYNIKHKLSDYQGKFLLLSFIKPNCNICLEHLQLLDELANKYPSKMVNLTVVCGDDFRKVVQYASDRNFEWPFLNLKNNILLLEAYNIRAYPSYVLINPDGSISMATAPMPDENLDLFLQRQFKRFDQKN